MNPHADGSCGPPAERALLRFQRPALPPLAAVAPYFKRAEDAAWFSNGGPCQLEFAARIGTYLGQELHAVPVANCTLGLMAVLRAVTMDSPRSRRLVVTPSYTFAAAASAILWSGFLPLFVDVDPLTWQLDPAELGDALDGHDGAVAAVLGTSTFGCPAPDGVERAWSELCNERGIPLIFDSAAGFGAIGDGGVPIGARGAAEVFSFHATKPFAIGEGGAITTGDEALARRLHRIVNFDFDADRMVMSRFGFNAKLDELHSAVGLAVLDSYDRILSARRRAAAQVVCELDGLGFRFQPGCAGGTWQHIAAQAPPGVPRDHIIRLGAAAGIEIRSYFDVPLHRQPAFSGFPAHGSLTHTDNLARHAVSFPMHNDLGPHDIERIVQLARSSTEVAARPPLTALRTA